MRPQSRHVLSAHSSAGKVFPDVQDARSLPSMLLRLDYDLSGYFIVSTKQVLVPISDNAVWIQAEFHRNPTSLGHGCSHGETAAAATSASSPLP